MRPASAMRQGWGLRQKTGARDSGHGTRDRPSLEVARAGSRTVNLSDPAVRVFRLYSDDGKQTLRAALNRFQAAESYEAEHRGTWVLRAVDETWGHGKEL